MRVELQIIQSVAAMIVGDLMAERLPEAFGGIGFGVVRWRVDETETVAVKGQGLAQLRGTRGRVDAQVSGKNDGGTSAFGGAGDEVVELAAIRVSRATQGNTVRKPTVAPVKGGKTDNFGAVAGSGDQALAVVAFARPTAGQGGMETNVDLVLDVEIGSGQERQQLRHIGRHAIPQLGFDERMPVERGGWSGGWRREQSV